MGGATVADFAGPLTADANWCMHSSVNVAAMWSRSAAVAASGEQAEHGKPQQHVRMQK